jgi:hypothetical protein
MEYDLRNGYCQSFSLQSFNPPFVCKLKDKGEQNCEFACILCGCKTWSLTSKEERRLKGSDYEALKRIVEPKRRLEKTT